MVSSLNRADGRNECQFVEANNIKNHVTETDLHSAILIHFAHDQIHVYQVDSGNFVDTMAIDVKAG